MSENIWMKEEVDIKVEDDNDQNEMDEHEDVNTFTSSDPLLDNTQRTGTKDQTSTNNSGTMDVIEELLGRPFLCRSFEEKHELLKKGRPTPDLTNLRSKEKACIRRFRTVYYERCQWLCGSLTRNGLFCWPCLLFSTTKTVPWTSTGYKHLANMSISISRHEKTYQHTRCYVALAKFSTTKIEAPLSEASLLHIAAHNEKVKRNREILKRLINAIAFLTQQDLLHADDDETTTPNPGHYSALLEYTTQFDKELLAHLQSSSVFQGVSKNVQNDLISSIATVLMSHIKQEITSSQFVAFIVDETTDVFDKSQFALVVRYCVGGTIYERFIKFLEVHKSNCGPALAKAIIDEINNIGVGKKLVSQSYDGAAVTSTELDRVQSIVKKKFGAYVAHVHCYAHVLNSVISSGLTSINEVKTFFAILNGLGEFFSASPKRTKFLDAFLKTKLPNVCPTKWNYSRLVNTTHENLPQMREVFRLMLDHPSEVDTETLSSATGHLHTLNDFSFCFLLKVFNSLYVHIDNLFSFVLNKAIDVAQSKEEVNQVLYKIELLRSSDFFNSFCQEVQVDVGPPVRRPRSEYVLEDAIAIWERLYFEILDATLDQLRVRFKDFDNLQFLSLLDPHQFMRHLKEFPQCQFDSITSAFSFFDSVRLKNELMWLYTSDDYVQSLPSQVYGHLIEYGFVEALPHLTTLAALISTLPITSASEERLFSSLKKVKSYSRNRTVQDKLSQISLLTIENQLLKSLKDSNNFFNDVVKNFAKDERLTEFTFQTN